VGVARDLGNGNLRVLYPSQSVMGRAPFWNTSAGGEGYYWEASGSADSLLYTMHPQDTSTNPYFVRYIPTVPYATDPATTIDVPYGTDERLVLGMARRSFVKESAASMLVERLIAEQDAEAAFTATGRGDGPRIRVVRRNPLLRSPSTPTLSTSPFSWRFS
jgi:hypothetical protein